ncbi:MAG: hypothetical protein PVF63_02975 [Gammaproteobacteria bacterium]|jgi:hypothetical protein
MNTERMLVWGSIGVVAAVVIAGLWLSGSPQNARAERLDERRIADLMRIVRVLERTWQDDEALPEQLEELVDGRRLAELPVDPVTQESYEYRRTARMQFELCADFARPAPRLSGVDNFWNHDAGHQCYAFDFAEQMQTGGRD